MNPAHAAAVKSIKNAVGNKMTENINVVEIKGTYIELYKLLKFENLAQSGGEAKYLVSEGLVKVNGDVETQKRKKIYPGDTVEFNIVVIRVAAKA
jgi:ribosome-associated protein